VMINHDSHCPVPGTSPKYRTKVEALKLESLLNRTI
jgi:hypothetical protein